MLLALLVAVRTRVLFRGPRLKIGVDVGRAHADINPVSEWALPAPGQQMQLCQTFPGILTLRSAASAGSEWLHNVAKSSQDKTWGWSARMLECQL
jgi:hypothetical protein